ncbi:universal stress protein [Pseudoduganella buxea]|uniref:Universal stress protein n=1 Tax=Pseudoduganella buxea TaxID=1949069 RepID=A0A6I3SUX2_9BURK|nr:universal stress protein [Pseudoduganella buxea]MTV52991.1 universal stress protein [Pseudoduganella buxea]GGC08931.1 universal stress protein [Pseudoduganella buxea]
MRKFQNILYISHGLADETDTLEQAFALARASEAELNILIVCPKLPYGLAQYRDTYEASLRQQVNASIESVRERSGTAGSDLAVHVELESGSTPATRIIRHVLKNAHDLVVKAIEPNDNNRGFRSLDMELLRKCPCPVWLQRPVATVPATPKIAVAIDPQSAALEGADLALRLLQLSCALAAIFKAELNIVSCWNYEFEDSLKNSPFIKIADDELQRIVGEAEHHHRDALENLIKKSRIGSSFRLHHLHGHADQLIPKFTAENDISLLVMGTVARTGIPGFLIGNTAEDIVQKLECSLLASKPNGFVSPVKAY